MNLVLRQKLVLGLLILAFLVIGNAGMVSTGMEMHEGQMQNCPFMGITAICNMNPIEHMAAWQSLFAAIAPQLTIIGLLLLLSLLLIRRILHDFLKRRPLIKRSSFYYSREVEVFDNLRLAFARGLIHPKIF